MTGEFEHRSFHTSMCCSRVLSDHKQRKLPWAVRASKCRPAAVNPLITALIRLSPEPNQPTRPLPGKETPATPTHLSQTTNEPPLTDRRPAVFSFPFSSGHSASPSLPDISALIGMQLHTGYGLHACRSHRTPATSAAGSNVQPCPLFSHTNHSIASISIGQHQYRSLHPHSNQQPRYLPSQPTRPVPPVPRCGAPPAPARRRAAAC